VSLAAASRPLNARALYRASAIVGNFGLTQGPLIDVLASRTKPIGKLLVELPPTGDLRLTYHDLTVKKVDYKLIG
jgi:hypothetical protein